MQNRPARSGNPRQQRRQGQTVRQTSYVDLALGLVVAPNGLIVTKASEVAERPNLVCVLVTNGREDRYPASVVGVDRGNDVVLLKIDKTGLPTPDWGAEEDIKQDNAEKTVPIGTLVVTPVPNGPNPAILGAVSIDERSIPAENLSIGVSIDSGDSGQGARVLQTLPRSPASAVGLRQNDIITKINDTTVDDCATLIRFLEKISVGDELKLAVRRDNQTLLMTLKAADASELAERRNAMNQGGPLGISRVRDGFPYVMQHDTVLRPADCGGPIMTLDGKLLGVNIARAGRTETYALPAAKLRQIVETLQSQAKQPE